MEIIDTYRVPVDSDWTYKDIFMKWILPVRYIENKPSMTGKIKREMQPLSSSNGKVLNINVAAFLADAYRETVYAVVTEISRIYPEDSKTVSLKDKFISMVMDKQFSAQKLFMIYNGNIWLEDGGDRINVNQQDMGKEFTRYANLLSNLKVNGYLR